MSVDSDDVDRCVHCGAIAAGGMTCADCGAEYCIGCSPSYKRPQDTFPKKLCRECTPDAASEEPTSPRDRKGAR